MRRQRYAAWSKTEATVRESSSGGLFFEMALQMLEFGGKVVGVIMDGTKAKYVMTDDVEIIKQMRKSKYIASNPKQVIKEMQKEKGLILFFGLPCHVKAVEKMCNMSNIITCALQCWGLPKKGVFEKYIRDIAKGREIKTIEFRDKRAGWNVFTSLTVRVVFTNGDVHDSCAGYIEDYRSRKNIRGSCDQCLRRRKNNRITGGDMDIGDYWQVPECLKNSAGTSIVRINTVDGRYFFNLLNNIAKLPIRVSLRHRLFLLLKSVSAKPPLQNFTSVFSGGWA
jgi:hypothetical protein